MLTIWCNAVFPPRAAARLAAGLAGHRLVVPAGATADNLAVAPEDPLLEGADVAFGQPDPGQLARLSRLRFVQLTTAGYARYDTARVRDALARHGTALCNASSVYAEPCAQHVLAMMLALARRLPHALDNQRGAQAWPYLALRGASRLLNGELALLVGYGAIARRLAELLAPLGVEVVGFRREARGESVRPIAELDAWLPRARHVVNVLPGSASTARLFDAGRFARMADGACYYNVGRGSTNDEAALLDALRSGRIAAYVDAFESEPLPPDHPLWTAPNCFVTPHTAGGHATEAERHVELFLENLRRCEAGEGLLDRVA